MSHIPHSKRSVDPQTEPQLKPLDAWHQRKLLVAYGWRQRRAQVISAAALLFVIVPLLMLAKALSWPSTHVVAMNNPATWLDWLNNFQIVFGFLTLLVASFVWLNELKVEWEQGLPLRMSVFFFRNREPAIVCQHVWLSSVGDLRQWAQQVASQAVDEPRLKFSPNVTSTRAEVCQSPDGSVCVLHAVKFQLSELPKYLLEHHGVCSYQNLLVGDQVDDVSIQDAMQLPGVSQWLRSADPSTPQI